MNKLEYLNKELGKNYFSLDEVDWGDVSYYQHLTDKFMRIFCDDLDWIVISKYQDLSEDFIKEFQDKVNWDFISKYQILSEDFIMEFQDKLDWLSIIRYQKLSEEFRNKHRIKVDKEKIWLYKTAEEKKQAVINTGMYECHDDYFIAYKAISIDRSSLRTKRYIYNKGETYYSNCDTTEVEDSFGLSAWTYKEAQDYGGDQTIVVKVKIYYKDLGRVVHQNNKIRCFKLTILE